jgi:MtN3 and saliva related transmembrane protein
VARFDSSVDSGVYTGIVTGARRIGQRQPHLASVATAPGRTVTNPQANRLYCGFMNSLLIDTIGMTGAVLTTVCWVPQAVKIIRSRETAAISLVSTLAFTIGIVFWLVYGLALMDWPLITSNVVTLALMSVIVALKLRHG